MAEPSSRPTGSGRSPDEDVRRLRASVTKPSAPLTAMLATALALAASACEAKTSAPTASPAPDGVRPPPPSEASRLSDAISDATRRGSQATDAQLDDAFVRLRALFPAGHDEADAEVDGRQVMALTYFISGAGRRAVDRVEIALADPGRAIPRSVLLRILAHVSDPRVIPDIAKLPVESFTADETLQALNACMSNESESAAALFDRLPVDKLAPALHDFAAAVRDELAPFRKR